MRALRIIGNTALWLIAVVGVLSVLVFGASRTGHLKPLVVISGSMQPGIMTGDLLFDTPHPTSELKVGDVASIPSAVTGKLISHRVVAVVAKDGHYEVNLKGDANKSADAETYVVGDTVWRPVLQVPHGGYVITTLTTRSVALPIGIALLALLGLTLLSSDDRPAGRRRSGGAVEAVATNVPETAPTADHPAASVPAVDDQHRFPAVDDQHRFPDRIADLTSVGQPRS